jgi:hypothetical protein
MANGPSRHSINWRKNHPLVRLMRRIRQAHRKKQVDIDACMGLPFQTLKQIEGGRRELPGILGGGAPPLSDWIQKWLTCVGATEAERTEVENLLMRIVIYGL